MLCFSILFFLLQRPSFFTKTNVNKSDNETAFYTENKMYK